VKNLDGMADDWAVMTGTIGKWKRIRQSLGAPRAGTAQAELRGVLANGLLDLQSPVTRVPCLNISKHPSDRVVACISPIKKTLYTLSAQIYGGTVIGPKAFRLKTEPSPRPNLRAVKPNVQSLASLALSCLMAFSGFLVNAERIGPGWGCGVTEDVIDGVGQFPGDMLLLSANEIGGRERCITQRQKCMHASHEDIGICLAVRRYAGWLIVRPFSQVSSLRAMDSETMSMASILA